MAHDRGKRDGSVISIHQDVLSIKAKTLQWVQSFIVSLNICPFAKHVLVENRLGIVVAITQDLKTALEELMLAVKYLDEHASQETTLVVFPNVFADFYDYLDFIDMAERLLSMESYDGIYQLATFHPKYCFAGVDKDDVSNYTNKSPYPMVHIIRESSIDKAISFYGDTSTIPEKNIRLLQTLGLDRVKQLIQLNDEYTND